MDLAARFKAEKKHHQDVRSATPKERVENDYKTHVVLHRLFSGSKGRGTDCHGSGWANQHQSPERKRTVAGNDWSPHSRRPVNSRKMGRDEKQSSSPQDQKAWLWPSQRPTEREVQLEKNPQPTKKERKKSIVTGQSALEVRGS